MNQPSNTKVTNSLGSAMIRKYIAAPVPRNIRQKRLGHLPLDCIIGFRATKDDIGANIVFDIIMLPVREFYRVKLLAGLQYSPNPTLTPGGSSVGSAYVLTNVKSITVPENEPNPKDFAKAYFIKEFGINGG